MRPLRVAGGVGVGGGCVGIAVGEDGWVGVAVAATVLVGVAGTGVLVGVLVAGTAVFVGVFVGGIGVLVCVGVPVGVDVDVGSEVSVGNLVAVLVGAGVSVAGCVAVGEGIAVAVGEIRVGVGCGAAQATSNTPTARPRIQRLITAHLHNVAGRPKHLHFHYSTSGNSRQPWEARKGPASGTLASLKQNDRAIKYDALAYELM
jgi:hypothetical protein